MAGKSSGLASIVHECARCGTKQNLEELSRYPDLKCKNCGYRTLKKVGPPAARKLERSVSHERLPAPRMGFHLI